MIESKGANVNFDDDPSRYVPTMRWVLLQTAIWRVDAMLILLPLSSFCSYLKTASVLDRIAHSSVRIDVECFQ
jgi:hypothetical protein